MARYWNDFLSHSQANNGAGGSRGNHKYVYRKNIYGKWRYYYPEDIAAMKNVGTKVVKAKNDAMSTIINRTNAKQHAYNADKRVKEKAIKEQIQAQKRQMRAKGISKDAVRDIANDMYRISKGDYIDTKDTTKIYRGTTQDKAKLINDSANSIINQQIRYFKSSDRNTKNLLGKKKKKKTNSRTTKNLLAKVANKSLN